MCGNVQYYLMGAGEEEQGWADLPTLNTWIAKGRLFPDSQLQAVETGQVITASDLPGLNFDVPISIVEPDSNYPREPELENVPNTGHMDVIFSWILLLTSFFACPLIGNAFGWFLADRAVKEGYPSGTIIKRVHTAVLALYGILLIAIVYSRIVHPK